MRQQDLSTISNILPFSFLPKEKIESLLPHFAMETHEKEKILFVQEISRIEHFYIIIKGSAELYFEHEQEKILKGILAEGDTFGGISILMNNSISVRTIKLIEETIFFKLPASVFLELCNGFEHFKEYFTNTFGKKMLDRSYAGIIAKQISGRENTMPFFNQPVSSIFRPNILSCTTGNTIRQAAEKMAESRSAYIFVKDEQGAVAGIITDADLRKVAGGRYDSSAGTGEIMSTPLMSVSIDDQVFEAFLTMIEKDIKHLAVTNKAGEVSGVLTDRNLLAEQGKSPYFLIQEIRNAEKFEQIEHMYDRLPPIMLEPIKNGAKSDNLTRLITTFSDAILDKIIQFSVDRAGLPPCDFAFMVMGSEGRREQTLKTDQDNAIVYEDIVDPEKAKECSAYFSDLAETICNRLDRAGFDFCEGGNMAKNPTWCKPLSTWKTYFFDWIHTADPKDLLYSSIFFDFRCARGEQYLTDELHNYLFKSLEGWAGFFRNLTENALYFKPPLGFFRNILVESKGEHKDSFDIKRAMMPIIDFARIYALKNSIRETNTLLRLFRLYTRHVLTKEEYNDMVQAYHFLMHLRFIRQITAVTDENGKADNYINPKNLSRIDQTMLKEIFKRIEKIQQKLSIEITGVN